MLVALTPNTGCSAKTPPWYEACGPPISGNLREPSAFLASQSKELPSTMTPPMEVPWPPIHLVADSTTMSTPKASGRQV